MAKVTFGLPQPLDPSASPTFAGLTLSGLTAGRIIFTGTGGLLSTSANLSYNAATGLTLSGNLVLPSSTGATPVGIIYKGASPFISDFNYGNNGTVTTDGRNTFVGVNAGNLTMGSTATLSGQSSYNNAVGYSSLSSNTTGSNNNAVGYSSLSSNTTGSNNNAVGTNSLFDLGSAQTAGQFNVGTSYTIASVGTTDFTLIGAADNNVGTVFTASGVGTGTGTATPNNTDNNTAVGHNTGRGIIYGTGNTILGANVTGLSAGLTNNIIIADGTGNQRIKVDASGNATFSVSNIQLGKTITAGGTTGNQTINKTSGSVNLAASATSLVVTNSLVSTNSVIVCTVAANDTTCKSVAAVAVSGSFTIYPNAAPTAETRVNFLVTN